MFAQLRKAGNSLPDFVMRRTGSIMQHLIAVGLLSALCADASIIAEHSGSTDPSTEGFVVPAGYNGGNGAPVTNDLGLGINAWNINGSWCCSAEIDLLSSAQEGALSANDWLLTVNMRVLSTADTGTGYGPNSEGGVVTVGVNGLRFSVDLHSDGSGDMVLAPDPFAAGPTYTIDGLGSNYALIQIAYDAATRTADYYVNGAEVLSGITGYTNYYESWFGFGGEDSNFNLVELQSDTTIGSTSPAVPEPSSMTLLGFGVLLLACSIAGFRRRVRF